MSTLFPDTLQDLITRTFANAAQAAYADVATVDSAGYPHNRTIHQRYLPEFEAFAFASNIHSGKWQDLAHQPHVAGCYYDHGQQIEFRWEGPVTLITDGPIRAHNWQLMRERLRREYWQCHTPDAADVSAPCPNMGIVLCRPILWDVYIYPHPDPAKARTVYTHDGNTWQARNVSIIDSRPL